MGGVLGHLARIGTATGLGTATATKPTESAASGDSDSLASVLARLRAKACRLCGQALRDCECKTDTPKEPATLRALGLDSEFWDSKLEDFDDELATAVRALVENPKLVRGILVTGFSGRGKTRLLAAALQHFIDAGGYPKFYLSADLFTRLSSVYDQNPTETRYSALGDLTGCPFLGIDDLGREGKPTDFVLSALHQIVSKRHGNYRPTIVTTNLSLHELERRYDAAIASRIGSWLPVVMDGRDWRA